MSKIACVVAYPSTTKEGGATKFDMDYYLATHMTMIDKYWAPHGMKSWDVKTFPKDKSLDVRPTWSLYLPETAEWLKTY
jgi:hypothetical protein